MTLCATCAGMANGGNWMMSSMVGQQPLNPLDQKTIDRTCYSLTWKRGEAFLRVALPAAAAFWYQVRASAMLLVTPLPVI